MVTNLIHIIIVYQFVELMSIFQDKFVHVNLDIILLMAYAVNVLLAHIIITCNQDVNLHVDLQLNTILKMVDVIV